MANQQTKVRQEAADRARQLTVRTLEKLDELGLPSTPDFYELWFRYFEGHPDIVRAINAHTGHVDELVCMKIHGQFLSTVQQEGAVHKVNDKVQMSISSLVQKLKSASAATSEYGDSLSGVSDKVSNAKTLDDLGEVVTVMLDDTKKMVAKNKELEADLVASSRQVEELRNYLDTAKKEATTDGLTEISNRKAFDSAIAAGVAEAHEKGTPLTLLMLDIDHFKKFNDTYGHPMGDQVLRLVAKMLVGNIKGQDTAARYGGEEFSVILPGTPLEAGVKVAESLRRAIEARELINKSDGKKLGAITISIGAAELKMKEPVSSIIERADAALYQAKHSGRNRVSVAE